MACCLEISTTAKEDYVGDIGCEVTLTMKAPPGVGVEILHIRYAAKEIDSEAPYQFTIKKGRRFLVVLADCTKPGALLQLIEICGPTKQVIDRFNFDPGNPARGYVVLGE